MQTISGSLTVKGRSERRVSQSVSKNKENIKENIFFSFDKWEIFVDQGKDTVKRKRLKSRRSGVV